MKEITNEEHNRIMLEMLIDFDNFCRENGITYFVAYGTLIGAMRHHGFIPWDDDVDIQMPRPDYEKLRKLCRNNKMIGKNTEFVDYRDKRNFCDFGKLSDVRTVSIDHNVKYRYEPLGVDIDIFIIDGYPENQDEHIAFCRKKRKFLELVNLNKSDFRKLTFKEKIKKIILLPIVLNLNLIWNMYEKHIRRYPYETSRYVGRTTFYYETDMRHLKELYAEIKYLDFEGLKVSAPIGAERLIFEDYCFDYSVVPPPEYRKSHHNYTAYWKEGRPKKMNRSLMKFFDILHNNRLLFPDRVIFEDDLFGEYTFDIVEDSSARIYSYLSEQKIEKEDIVVIRMKRSAKIFLAMLGVWKAGAAFAVIGEHSPEKYVSQVLKDINPKLIIDDKTFEEAMKRPAKEGFEKSDNHDLACIVYSTGSSGFFKGSMHEFGAIEKVIEKFDAAGVEPLYKSEKDAERNIIFSGFYAIDAVMELIWAVYWGSYYYIMPYQAMLEFPEYLKKLQEKKIEIVCVAPNTYKKLKPYNLPHLKRIDLSLDVTTDDLNEYYTFTNTYALTEAFGMVTSSYIEGKYDIIPGGKPCPLTQVMIAGKGGEELPKGEIGEICVVNEFFRGYLNLPELTSKVLYDGWFHTGDMGYVDKDGNYVVLGRKIDMLETEEGFIVPIFISVQIRKLFPDISKTYVKIFSNENGIKICLYYCGDKEYDISDFRLALKGNIPDYMLPTHCIKKVDFEYFAFGKINRLSFEEPD